MQITPKREEMTCHNWGDLLLTCQLALESELKSCRLLPSRKEVRYSCSTVFRNKIKPPPWTRQMNIIRLQLTLSIAFSTACAGLLTRTAVRLPWLHFKPQLQMNRKLFFNTCSNKTACQNYSFFHTVSSKSAFSGEEVITIGVSEAVHHGTWSFRSLSRPYWTTHINSRSRHPQRGQVSWRDRRVSTCAVFVGLRENQMIFLDH